MRKCFGSESGSVRLLFSVTAIAEASSVHPLAARSLALGTQGFRDAMNAFVRRLSRVIAGLAAAVGWAGLALQYALMVPSLGPALGLWRFAGFFTILTNIGAAAVATSIALGVTRGLGGT